MRVVVNKSRLEAIKRDTGTEAGAVVKKMAFDALGYAMSFAPVDTGNLKNNLQAVEENQTTWLLTSNATGADGYPYDVAQEYGFIHWRGGQTIRNPFILPAFERVVNNAPSSIG